MFLFRSDLKKEVVKFPCRLTDHLESYVSRLLEEAGIPSFIWGEAYLGYLGSTTALFFSGWVIPDQHIDKAAEVLTKAGFPPCTQGRSKCAHYCEARLRPIPDYDFHTDHKYPPVNKIPSAGVCLFRKSRVFWTFPDPTLGPPPKDDPYYRLTTDPRVKQPTDYRSSLPPPNPSLYPVKMAVVARYFEAIVLLNMRDFHQDDAQTNWEVQLLYLFGSEHIWGLNLKLEDIREPFREYAKRRHEPLTPANKDYSGTRYLFALALLMRRRNLLPTPEGKISQLETLAQCAERLNVKIKQSDLEYERLDKFPRSPAALSFESVNSEEAKAMLL
ncbi:hypothetical protein BJY04DRAFT_224401 [Aspergillus karnatakaensis]|uniref:uncharacterized protein n=1 Tax=Aspergillus karnatakaensis TaxID=1810916 RepID=UPI003CCD256A